MLLHKNNSIIKILNQELKGAFEEYIAAGPESYQLLFPSNPSHGLNVKAKCILDHSNSLPSSSDSPGICPPQECAVLYNSRETERNKQVKQQREKEYGGERQTPVTA